MTTLILRWHIRDEGACEICKELDGYEWQIPVEVGGASPDVLEHPVYGIVWDARGSRSHSHKYHVSSCRCRIELDAEIKELLEMGKAKLAALKEGKAQGDRTVE